jgi:hypothetical protein
MTTPSVVLDMATSKREQQWQMFPMGRMTKQEGMNHPDRTMENSRIVLTQADRFASA